MARNFARRHQDCVETDIADDFARIGCKPHLGGGGNSPALPLANGFRSLIKTRAGFYFSEDQKLTSARDDIYFAEWASPTPRENAKSLCHQESSGTAFGGDADPKGSLPFRTRRRPYLARRLITLHHHRQFWRARVRADKPRGVDARLRVRPRRQHL